MEWDLMVLLLLLHTLFFFSLFHLLFMAFFLTSGSCLDSIILQYNDTVQEMHTNRDTIW